MPIKKYIYLHFLWQKYGSFMSNRAFPYGKIVVKVSKIRCAVEFLKSWETENLFSRRSFAFDSLSSSAFYIIFIRLLS